MSYKVVRIDSDSLLRDLGIEEGDSIESLNGQTFSSSEELKALFEAEKLEIKVLRNGEKSFVVEAPAVDYGAVLESPSGRKVSFSPGAATVFTSLKPNGQMPDNKAAEPTVTSDEAEPTQSKSEIMLLLSVWVFVISGAAWSLMLVAEIGMAGDDNLAIGLLFGIGLGSMFAIGLVHILCHYKRHLSNIERELILLRKETLNQLIK